MATFNNLNEYLTQKGVIKSFSDLVNERDKRKNIKELKGFFSSDKVLLLMLPKNKLKKVIEARYNLKQLKKAIKQTNDVKTLRELRKKERLYKNIIGLYSSIRRRYIQNLNNIVNKFEKERRHRDKLVNDLNRLINKYNRELKIYNKISYKSSQKQRAKAIARKLIRYKKRYNILINKIEQKNKTLKSLMEEYNKYKQQITKEFVF